MNVYPAISGWSQTKIKPCWSVNGTSRANSRCELYLTSTKVKDLRKKNQKLFILRAVGSIAKTS